MENKVKELLNGATESLENFCAYARFVNDSEFFAEQNPEVFADTNMHDKFNQIWVEMEIINAFALCEWEELGRPKDFCFVWNTKYKKDAEEILYKLKQCFNYI